MASDDRVIDINIPPDHIVIEGHHDHLSKRVDVSVPPEIINNAGKVGYSMDEATRIVHKIIDYQPPAPSTDHEWDAQTKRWQISAAAQAKAAARSAALARIAALEASQHRHIRGLALGKPGAKEALQAIDEEIISLESQIV
jgi:hypothetical protein